MKLEDQIYKSILEYPSLFWTGDIRTARLAVMEHLFTTSGNGYAWSTDGYLCEMEHAIDTDFNYNGLGWTCQGPAYGVLKFDKRDVTALGKSQSWGPDSRFYYIEQPVTIYPLSDHSLRFPDNIQDDWLDGLIEFLEFALECFANPEYKDGDGKIQCQEKRERQAVYVRQALERAQKIKASR